MSGHQELHQFTLNHEAYEHIQTIYRGVQETLLVHLEQYYQNLATLLKSGRIRHQVVQSQGRQLLHIAHHQYNYFAGLIDTQVQLVSHYQAEMKALDNSRFHEISMMDIYVVRRHQRYTLDESIKRGFVDYDENIMAHYFQKQCACLHDIKSDIDMFSKAFTQVQAQLEGEGHEGLGHQLVMMWHQLMEMAKDLLLMNKLSYDTLLENNEAIISVDKALALRGRFYA